LLDRRGIGILVYELQGDVSFASMESLTRAVANQLSGSYSVLFDGKRLGAVDAGATGLLGELAAMVLTTGRPVYFSNLAGAPDARRALEAVRTGTAHGRVIFFHDLDAALQACEDHLIADEGTTGDNGSLVGLGDQELMAGFDDCELRLLESMVVVKTYEAGTTIFGEGDDPDALYFVGAGAVDLLLRSADGGRQKRLATVGPGVAFGEMAILDGCPRSTTARAEEWSQCHVLAIANLERLAADHPGLALCFYRNLAGSLSMRLRSANAEIRSLEH